jgi:long-chain acyl-CoA synthetase
VPGCEIAIRDPGTGAELARGEAGEICGRGDNVMSGYWNQPELTRRTLPGGWLRTGDVGYLDADGFLYVTGRLDDMIITGAENVFPSDVEDVLYRHEAVAEAAVIGLPDPSWGQRVHAVVVLRPGSDSDDEQLALFCRQRLASYKCPRSFEFRDALSKTGAGKIDRRLLVRESTLDE